MARSHLRPPQRQARRPAIGRRPKRHRPTAGFGNWFRERCDEAGLPMCTAHGLKKSGATIAAENGATDRQLMAMFDWESPRMAWVYTKAAEQKRLAGEAMFLISLDRSENPDRIDVLPFDCELDADDSQRPAN